MMRPEMREISGTIQAQRALSEAERLQLLDLNKVQLTRLLRLRMFSLNLTRILFRSLANWYPLVQVKFESRDCYN